MLNENVEFKAYVTKPKSRTPRVCPKLFTNYFDDGCELNGIEEIMTVIARAFIFSDGRHNRDDIISDEVLNDTIELLHRWTGFSDIIKNKETENSDITKNKETENSNITKNKETENSDTEKSKITNLSAINEIKRTENPRLSQWMKKHSFVDGWLEKYWKYQYKHVETSKKSKLSEKELWGKVEDKWNKSLNSVFDYRARQITYKNVIANALEMGPLRNRYLVVKKDKDQIGKKVKKEDPKRFKYLSDESRRQQTSIAKYMKVIAVYLIKQECHPEGQKEVWIKNSELSRWYGKDEQNNGSETWYPTGVLWKGRPIYTLNSLRGNYTKVSVDPDYLEEYEYKIIEEKDVNKYKMEGKYWVLKDLGHGLKDCWKYR